MLVGVEGTEEVAAFCLRLVLGFAGVQRFGQIAPEPVEPGVGHRQHSADVRGRGSVEEGGGLGRVVVARLGAVAATAQEPEGDERVEEVGSAARVEAETFADLVTRQLLRSHDREEVELNG